MPADNTKIRVGYAGAIYIAPVGTTFPTNVSVAADTTTGKFVHTGYISDDGVTQTFGQNNAEFMAWGNTTAPVLTRTTSEETTFSFTLLQTTKDILGFYYGVPSASITDTAAANPIPAYSTMIKTSASTPDIRAMLLDVIDGTTLRRICVPRMQITDRGDLTYKSDELVSYQVTVRALLASDGSAFTMMITDL